MDSKCVLPTTSGAPRENRKVCLLKRHSDPQFRFGKMAQKFLSQSNENA